MRLSRSGQYFCRHSSDSGSRGAVPLRSAGHRSAGGESRRRRCERIAHVGAVRGASAQPRAWLRHGVRDTRPDDALFGDLARACLGEPTCRTDPPADSRDRRSGLRQSPRPGADARLRRRPRPPRPDIQQDDLRIAAPADWPHRGQRAERRDGGPLSRQSFRACRPAFSASTARGRSRSRTPPPSGSLGARAASSESSSPRSTIRSR